MFEGVNPITALWTTLWVLVGLLLRTFVPYLVAAYKLVKETNEWKLPRFEPKYVLPPAATLGLYVLAVLTVPDALLVLTLMHPSLLIAAVYAGQDVFRQGFKAVWD